MAMDSHYFSSTSSAAVIRIEYSSQFRILQMIPLTWPAGIWRHLQPCRRGRGQAQLPFIVSRALQIASFSLLPSRGHRGFRRRLYVKGERDPRRTHSPRWPLSRKGTGLNGHQNVGELISGFGYANFTKSRSWVGIFPFPHQEAFLCALLQLSRLHN